MTLKELEIQLHALTPAERVDAFQILTQTLSSHSLGITKTQDMMSGGACIANTRLPVWLFVSLRGQGATDAALLEAYPHLTAADLVNVWAYADAHTEEIATALREQETAIHRKIYNRGETLRE
jgi:uncharacterized protein (DUF433 family)